MLNNLLNDKGDTYNEVTYNFELDIKRIGFQLSLETKIFSYFKNLPKKVNKTKSWEIDFYNMFLNNTNDLPILNQILEKANFFAKDKEEIATIIINFVQGGLSYDFEKVNKKNLYVNYPYETLYLGKGICSDKSILLAKLLINLNYKVAFLIFKNANHMALGLKVEGALGNYQTSHGSYAVIETTSYHPIGELPTSMQINELPSIILPFFNGTNTFSSLGELKKKNENLRKLYGDDYTYANAYQKNVLIELKKMEDKRKVLENELNNTKNINIYNATIKKYNDIINNMNTLSRYYNEGEKI